MESSRHVTLVTGSVVTEDGRIEVKAVLDDKNPREAFDTSVFTRVVVNHRNISPEAHIYKLGPARNSKGGMTHVDSVDIPPKGKSVGGLLHKIKVTPVSFTEDQIENFLK